MIARARSSIGLRIFSEICRILLEAEQDTPGDLELRGILEKYGEKDKFSTWLYMHSYRELGDRLRPRKEPGPAAHDAV